MDKCPICGEKLRWDMLAVDLCVEKFMSENPNALECLITDNGIEREKSFFDMTVWLSTFTVVSNNSFLKAKKTEGETVINISSMIPTRTKVKKVFEVGLEEEDEKLTKTTCLKETEAKLSKKRYFSDLDQRKQLLERKAEI